jgi:antitoxin (DNA-binding transcriptional repressor) of toxin-antitoxin stability system
MKTVSKGILKAKMLEYFREVERTGEPLIVTDHGHAVLEVRPIQRRSTIQEVLAEYRSGSGPGCANIPTGEILEPIPTAEWEALREEA